MTEVAAEWSGRVAFGPYWFLYSGPLRRAGVVAQDAFKIVVHAGGTCILDEMQRPISGPVVVIEPGRPHAVVNGRDHALVAFIDPDSRAGQQLRGNRFEASPVRSVHPVIDILGALRPANWSRAEEAVRRILAAVCDAPIATPMSWWRSAALDAALLRVPDLPGTATVDVAVIAEEAGVSVTGLTHVFVDEIGVPLRAYARWLRLVHGVERLALGETLADAARDSGFVDAAEFVHKFEAMFGLCPVDAGAAGVWLVP